MSDPVIKVRTISAFQEVATQLTNGLWARTAALPGGWSKIRIGARMHVTNAGGLTAGTKFAFGLCSGLTNVFGDATTTHFAGLYSPDTSGFNGAGFYVWAMNFATKVNTTLTTSGALAGMTVGGNADSDASDFVMCFCDITKGSPNYTFQSFYNVVNAVPTGISQAQWATQMVTDPPVFSSYAQSSPTTLAVDEGANGVFDSVNFYYSTLLNILEVCDVGITQLA